MKVLNQFPSITLDYHLAIIGEAPNRDDEHEGKPFSGVSGRFLSALLSRAGINREACFLGNICQTRPPEDNINLFSWDGPEIQEGLAQLRLDLKSYQPILCLLLGKTALKAAKDVTDLSVWRGSLFTAETLENLGDPFLCLPSYNPAYCLRDYSTTPYLMFDLRRAKQFAYPGVFRITTRNFNLAPKLSSVLQDIESCHNFPLISLDIEGYWNNMTCLSIAKTPTDGFIIPFVSGGGTSFWAESEEVEIWRALSRLLISSTPAKVLQNSLYDRFVLQYGYHCPIRNVSEDTMLKWWELYCELEKGLAVQTSILTLEPYYKMMRKGDNSQLTFWEYCCKDSAITYEISNKLTPYLDGRATQHYKFNVSLLEPILYMELRGIRYDTLGAAERRKKVQEENWTLQKELNNITGYGICITDTWDLIIPEVMCYKRDPSQPKKGYAEAYKRAKQIESNKTPSEAELGELDDLLEKSLNVESKVFRDYLYITLALPVQYKTDPKTKLKRPTADYEALLKLLKKVSPDSLAHKVLTLAIQIRSLRTNEQMLGINADNDGRIRCGYNVVGTETGRLTCYTSPTGSGYNLQTIPQKDRDLFIADPEHWLFQCDLSGADGWTVAAHCANLGNRTMLEDLFYGLKPAKILCLMLRHGASVATQTRDQLKEQSKTVRKEDWDYFACKIGQHGTCYLMGKRKLANQIFIQSEGKVTLSERETEDLQNLFHLRYQVRLWHDYTSRLLARKAEITAASGHRRVFFGRKEEILGQALAHEPQANTTYATNLAAWKLWSDKENRYSEGNKLRIEPLHQVHDALIGQFPQPDTTWAVPRIKSYFANPLIIAGTQITIPFEGHYGPSWGEQTQEIV